MCAYHRVREAIATRVIVFKHIKSEDNFSDIMTKPLAGEAFHKLVKPFRFRQPKWGAGTSNKRVDINDREERKGLLH